MLRLFIKKDFILVHFLDNHCTCEQRISNNLFKLSVSLHFKRFEQYTIKLMAIEWAIKLHKFTPKSTEQLKQSFLNLAPKAEKKGVKNFIATSSLMKITFITFYIRLR